MVSPSQISRFAYHESGLRYVRDSGRDAWLLILLRCFRMLAYGTISLILALFFSTLDFSDFRIGLFMTLTLLGDVVLSAGLTLIADRVGRRKVLLGGSVLMVCSGAIFACFENFWILLLAAVVGVISATGGDFGPFRAIEESTLSTLTTPKTRADVLAWYVTTASVGSAVGSELSGRLVTSLLRRDGWTTLDAYHAVFWVYSGIGVLNILLTLLLSSSCELSVLKAAATEEAGALLDSLEGRTEEDDESPSTGPSLSKPEKKVGFAQVSKETLSVMYKLWFLLIVDSLADGMVGYSLTVYYLDQKFSLSKSTLGDVVSISYFLSSFSTIFAGPLARRLGLINTMVFTHLPSSAAVLLFPAPNSVILTVTFFFLRTGLNNMDQAPRSAFLAAVVKEEERTAVMGITSMLRTLAAAAGPTVTGVLAGQDRFWIAFVAAGTLRIAYDLGLFTMFVNMKLYQHEKTDVEGTYREVDEEGRNSAADTEGRVREQNN